MAGKPGLNFLRYYFMWGIKVFRVASFDLAILALLIGL